jgi:hypothetical protein
MAVILQRGETKFFGEGHGSDFFGGGSGKGTSSAGAVEHG